MTATYWDSSTEMRTLTGPARRLPRSSATRDPAFAGGSYVVVQKYLHDLAAWNALPVEEQERAVGRTKLEDIELPDGVKAGNSHVALNTIVDGNGEQRQILRYNMPFGRVGAGEFGTYFIGYTASPDVIEQMLTNMFVGDPAGNHDRILDFSTAVTGSLFFAPATAFLDDPPRTTATSAAAEPVTDTAVVHRPTTDDESLGIGSLRGASS